MNNCTWKLAALLGCLCCGAVALAAEPAVRLSDKYAQTDEAEDRNQQVRQQLAAETKIAFINTPLVEVIAYLKKLHGIDIQLDLRALEDVGIDAQSPVSFDIEGVSLRSGLRLLLSQLELTYLVEEGRLLITTPEAAEADLTTVYYPCPELLYRPGHERQDDEQPDYGGLIDLIIVTLDPESWCAAASGSPEIHPLEEGFVIRQSPAAHEKIAALLAALSKAKSLPSDEYDPTPIVADPAATVPTPQLRDSLQKQGMYKFIDTPLIEVVDYVRQITHAPVVLDQRALDDVGLSPDQPVTLDVGKASTVDLFRYLRRDLDLTCVLESEAIVVTTLEQAESALSVVVYPVRDLVGARDGSPRAVPVIGSGSQPLGGFGFDPGSGDYDVLMDAISVGVEPESWEQLGGPGTITFLQAADAIVVSQTAPTHAKIAQLLRDVRRDRRTRPEPTPEQAAAWNEPVLVRYPIPLGVTDGKREAIESFAKLLQSEVAAASWDGRICFVRSLGDRELLIKQTPTAHAEIRDWLAQLYPDSRYAGAPQSIGGTGGTATGGFGGGGEGGFGGAGSGIQGGGGFFSVPSVRPSVPNQHAAAE